MLGISVVAGVCVRACVRACVRDWDRQTDNDREKDRDSERERECTCVCVCPCLFLGGGGGEWLGWRDTTCTGIFTDRVPCTLPFPHRLATHCYTLKLINGRRSFSFFNNWLKSHTKVQKQKPFTPKNETNQKNTVWTSRQSLLVHIFREQCCGTRGIEVRLNSVKQVLIWPSWLAGCKKKTSYC